MKATIMHENNYDVVFFSPRLQGIEMSDDGSREEIIDTDESETCSNSDNNVDISQLLVNEPQRCVDTSKQAQNAQASEPEPEELDVLGNGKLLKKVRFMKPTI